MSGKLERIWVKPDHEVPMKEVDSGVLDAGKGLQGDINYEAHRPVTIIEAGRWKRVQEELGPQVDPSSRRANLLVSGVELKESKGKKLRIGKTLVEIRGETRPCEVMEEEHKGLRDALDADWGGGAFGSVLEGGAITPGDPVSWE